MSFDWSPLLRVLGCLAFALTAVPVLAAPPPAACKPGMETSLDTEGHCCWPGQAWHNRCIGKPTACPEGSDVKGEACVETPCPVGQEKMSDHLHCCWVGQAWSRTREKCIGVPTKCPAGTVADASSEQCQPKEAAAAKPKEVAAPAKPEAKLPPPPAAAPAVTCPNGQSVGPDTEGHCCWGGQVWQDRCVGKPSACPGGWVVKGDQCVEKPCDAGMDRVNGHCCWPGQAWSKSREVCVGTPSRCPANMTADADAESCKAPPPVVKSPPADAAGQAKAGDAAKCPRGQTIAPDTAGHCCPAAQRWSPVRNTCTPRGPGEPVPSDSDAEDAPAEKAPPPPPAKTKPPIRVDFDASGQNRAQDPAPRTETNTQTSVGRHSLGYQSETLEERTDPVDSINSFHMTLGYLGMFGSDISSNIGTMTIGWRHLDPSGDFPGAEGGSRSCFDFRLDFGAMGGVMTQKVPSYNYYSDSYTSESSTTTMYGGQATMSLMYTWLTFSERGAGSLRQSGFGLNLGLKLGAAYYGGGDSGGVSPIIGPDIGIEFPGWNPGSAAFSSFGFNFFVLPPIGGGAMSVAAGLNFDL